jgi:predicted amidohydrolase
MSRGDDAMSSYIKISTLASQYIHADHSDQIISHLNRDIDKILPDKPDLIVLPELCDIPVNYRNKKIGDYLTRSHDSLFDYFSNTAAKNSTNIIWPTVIEDNGLLFNTAFHINRNGEIVKRYDKIFTTSREYSEMNIVSGSEPVVFETDIGRIGCIICFDINFEELRDSYRALSLDIMVFPSMFHGSFLQKVWAYACQSYFVSSVGGLESLVVSPIGDILARSTNYTPYVTARINLDFIVAGLGHNSQKFEKLKKKYGEKVKIHDPGYLSTVLITAETADLSAESIGTEFDIKKWTDHIDECRKRVAYRSIENTSVLPPCSG